MSDDNDEQRIAEHSQETRPEGEQGGSSSSGETSLRNRALAGLGHVMHELGTRLVERFDDSETEHGDLQ